MQTTIYALLFVMAYFLPTILAAKGRRGSVFVINLCFGLTGIGWGIALYMAIRSRENIKEAV